jgi:hypothetical protein
MFFVSCDLAMRNFCFLPLVDFRQAGGLTCKSLRFYGFPTLKECKNPPRQECTQ